MTFHCELLLCLLFFLAASLSLCFGKTIDDILFFLFSTRFFLPIKDSDRSWESTFMTARTSPSAMISNHFYKQGCWRSANKEERRARHAPLSSTLASASLASLSFAEALVSSNAFPVFSVSIPSERGLNLPSISTSRLGSGLGCWASSSSLAERRSSRASSAGPKTVVALRRLFCFLELDRELLAISARLCVGEDGGPAFIQPGGEC